MPKGSRPAFPAKLTRPRPGDVLLRERLFRRLDDRRHPLIWISAPPGAGKTTLASSYLAQREVAHLWYQLDAGDDDLGTFFHYLGLAVGNAAPRLRRPLPHLTAEYLGGLAVFSRRYFEALASYLEPPFVLVFDNYQDVSPDAALHAVIREGIAALPQGFTTVVLSRAAPPAEQARPRANGSLILVDAHELQLTIEEVEGIGRVRGRRAPSPGELHDKTRGWAAGVVLLLEQDGRSAGSPADRSPQVLFDYFAGEIFERLDPGTRELLLASALLPKMKARALEELTGSPAAHRLLAELHARSYFTLKHPHDGTYEYHPLFREFLLSRAESALPVARLGDLRKRAAALSESDGQPEHAADLLHAAGDAQGLAQLVGRHARVLLEQGRGQVLEGWLARVPDRAYARDPWLHYWRGMCRLPFDSRQALSHFEQAYRAFAASGDSAGRCIAWCAVVDSFVFGWNDFRALEGWIAEMEDALSALTGPASPELDAQIACGMFLALMHACPQHRDMPRWEERVREMILHGGDPRLQEKAGNHLLIYYAWWIGDLGKAELLVTTLGAQVRRDGVAPLTRITWHVMAAAYYWMAAANERCVECVERGLEIGEASGVHVWDMLLYSQGVFGSMTSGDAARAARYLERMAARVDAGSPMEKMMYGYLFAWYRFAEGDAAGARELAQMAVAMAEGAGARFHAAVVRNDAGRVLFRLGDAEAGLALIRQARAEGRAMNARTIEYLTFLAEAEIAMETGDEASCVECLRRSLAIGRAQRFRNHTWWCSKTMAKLYAIALAHGVEEDYVCSVIVARGLPPPEGAALLASWPRPFRVRALGRFAVLKDGEPMDFAGKAARKPLELLKALIAFGGTEVGQETVMDALWPELDGDNARRAFDTTLYRLRKLLGDDAVLVLKDQKLTLDARLAWVDSRALEHGLERIGGALQSPAAAPELDALERQLCALYTGSLLAGETGAWAMAPREQLRDRFLRALERLGAHHEARGQRLRALRCYESGLAIEPAAETLHYRLIACHRALGAL